MGPGLTRYSIDGPSLQALNILAATIMRQAAACWNTSIKTAKPICIFSEGSRPATLPRPSPAANLKACSDLHFVDYNMYGILDDDNDGSSVALHVK
jgi:hypothetical protein